MSSWRRSVCRYHTWRSSTTRSYSYSLTSPPLWSPSPPCRSSGTAACSSASPIATSKTNQQSISVTEDCWRRRRPSSCTPFQSCRWCREWRWRGSSPEIGPGRRGRDGWELRLSRHGWSGPRRGCLRWVSRWRSRRARPWSTCSWCGPRCHGSWRAGSSRSATNRSPTRRGTYRSVPSCSSLPAKRREQNGLLVMERLKVGNWGSVWNLIFQVELHSTIIILQVSLRESFILYFGCQFKIFALRNAFEMT